MQKISTSTSTIRHTHKEVQNSRTQEISLKPSSSQPTERKTHRPIHPESGLNHPRSIQTMIGNFVNIVLPVVGLMGFSTSSFVSYEQQDKVNVLQKLTSFVHYAVDAVLVSVCFSGIKRSTGLSPAVSKIQNKEIRQVLVSYLEVGEWIMDFVIVFMGRSTNFERR
ncbi:hypothetical protein PSHT_12638 [Puccinia striiformis]|uniref:Uncharacterized protein n=1 Tax=Puccinia striiformis TaxID=27350 RepID=A0A2S4UVD5_9BASI|nr:hypothetical protein PSHT_12638 [Puccinia striiformis]